MQIGSYVKFTLSDEFMIRHGRIHTVGWTGGKDLVEVRIEDPLTEYNYFLVEMENLLIDYPKFHKHLLTLL